MANPPASALFTYDLHEWEREPGTAFDAFLSNYRFEGRALRASSFTIYRGMFSRLRDWALEQGLPWQTLDEAALEQFFQGRDLGAESRHRYLLLFTHLAQLPRQASQDAPSHNPARMLLLQREAPERDEPEWLDEDQLHQFIGALPTGQGWKRVRDRALVLLILGAGLRSSEALGLPLSGVHFKGEFLDSIWVPAHKPHPERQVPLQTLAHRGVQLWLTERAALAIPGTRVFPSNLSGSALTPVTLFRLVKATLAQAGIVKRYEGPTLLRNTCGARWLQAHEPWEVMQWMGHAQLRTTELLLAPERRSSAAPQVVQMLGTQALAALAERTPTQA
jgi:integrase/recombinase XerD